MATDCRRILAFYRGEGRDDRGRTLEDVLAFTHEELEYTHDYIQWLFPLDVPSSFQPSAPLVDRECQEKFRGDPTLSSALQRSFEMMLDFYGLQIVQQGASIAIQRGDNFASRAEVWLTPGNHNFLRLTRIMTSLDLLGQREFAIGFQTCLRELHQDSRRSSANEPSHTGEQPCAASEAGSTRIANAFVRMRVRRYESASAC